MPETGVSISWARFCLFKPLGTLGGVALLIGFNLLGEILFVQAWTAPDTAPAHPQFQSLGRDSVCSSHDDDLIATLTTLVSISWARFCLFKR